MDQEIFNHYRLHIHDRDEEHQAIFNHINKVYTAIDRHDYHRITELVHVILDEARTHFHNEERFMEEIKYPFIQHHKLKHIELRKKLSNMAINFPGAEKIKEMGKILSRHYVSSFEKAIVMHIDHEDRQYAEFLLKKNH